MTYRRVSYKLAQLILLASAFAFAETALAQVSSSFQSGSDAAVFEGPPATSYETSESVLAGPGGDVAGATTDEDGFFMWDGDYGNRCCGDCPPGWTARADYVMFRRERPSAATLSNAFALSEFDFEPGGRVTLTRHIDCLDAWELTYVGQFDWFQSGSATGVGLNSRLSSATLNLSEFNNATFHSQAYRSRLDNVEFNRRWYGWDVISTMIGARYIKLNERFAFNSTGGGGTGALGLRTDNDLFGVQIGMDLNYPVGRFYTTTVMKGGLFLNASQADVLLVNAGTTQIANSDDDVGVAAMLEFGFFVGARVTRNIRVRAGYEMWWITGVAVVTDQIRNPLTSSTGRHVNDGSDTFYHGFSAGAEITW